MIAFGNFEHAFKIARRAGHGFDPHVDYVLSRVNEAGELLGGVIYTNFTGRSVQLHQAGFDPHWGTAEFVWTVYDFAFNRLKVERIIATIPSTNDRAMKITQQMGFEYVTTIPGVVIAGDMEILSMSRPQCRWLKLEARYSRQMENAA